MNILEQIGFKQRKHVGISISANNFIELVCIDKTTKAVVKYSSNNIKYNNSIREIVDYDELTESIEMLFEDVGLNPKECSVTLSLPNVHFGITPLDGTSDTPFIIENIQTDIEDLYIFKRNEPAISFSILENGITRGQKNIVFSALQTKVVGKVIEIFDKLGAEIVRIDTSYSSLFKAIKFCDRFNKYVMPEEKTLVLLITANSCCAFYFTGPVISDVMEEPLAVKSFSSEEVYSAISKLATNSILKNSPKSLLIISEADEVDAQSLSQKLDFSGEVDCLNKSINNNQQFIEVYGLGSDIDSSMISYMTIEAAGAAAADYDEYPLEINFVPKERVQNNIVEVGNYEVPFDRYAAFVLLSALVVAGILGVLINTLCTIGMNLSRTSNESTKQDINVFQRAVEQNANTSKVDILPIMTKIVNRNRDIIDTYVSLSTDIPETVYIKTFKTQSNGGIGILGEARTSDSVQLFVDNLKEKNSDLMLTKLSINAQTDSIKSKIPDGYTFEIKTPDKNVNFEEGLPQQTQTSFQNMFESIRRGVSSYGNSSGSSLPPSPII